jgi:hypothetical protein
MNTDFTSLDPDPVKEFEAFFTLVKKDGVRILFVMAPYHTIAYEKPVDNSKYRIIVEAERYVKEFASRNGIEAFGSYNPENLGLDESYFLDGMHPKKAAIEKVLPYSR